MWSCPGSSNGRVRLGQGGFPSGRACRGSAGSYGGARCVLVGRIASLLSQRQRLALDGGASPLAMDVGMGARRAHRARCVKGGKGSHDGAAGVRGLVASAGIWRSRLDPCPGSALNEPGVWLAAGWPPGSSSGAHARRPAAAFPGGGPCQAMRTPASSCAITSAAENSATRQRTAVHKAGIFAAIEPPHPSVLNDDSRPRRDRTSGYCPGTVGACGGGTTMIYTFQCWEGGRWGRESPPWTGSSSNAARLNDASVAISL